MVALSLLTVTGLHLAEFASCEPVPVLTGVLDSGRNLKTL